MSKGKQAPRVKRKDANHDEIKRALEHAFISTVDIHNVGMGIGDILAGALTPCPKCGHKFPQNKLLEVKPDVRATLTQAEQVFSLTWRGQWVKVYTPRDALAQFGVKL